MLDLVLADGARPIVIKHLEDDSHVLIGQEHFLGNTRLHEFRVFDLSRARNVNNAEHFIDLRRVDGVSKVGLKSLCHFLFIEMTVMILVYLREQSCKRLLLSLCEKMGYDISVSGLLQLLIDLKCLHIG